MGYRIRAIFYPPPGFPSPRGMSFSFAGADAFVRAQARSGATRNLAGLGSTERAARRVFLGDDRTSSNFGICLAWRLYFQDTDNQLANWSTAYSSEFLSEYPGPFNDFTTGLCYGLHQAGTAAAFYSNSSLIGENKPWAVRTRLYKPPTGMEHPVVTFRAPGGLPYPGWQLEIARGRAAVMRLTAAWTQTQEDALHALLANETIDEAMQEQIDDLRILLYRDVTSVDVPGDLYGQVHTFVFIPEPRGVVSIFDGQGAFVGQWHDSAILATRKDGVLWPAGQLWVRSNGPAVDWQFGRLEFAASGQLRLGPYKNFTSGDWAFTVLRSVQDGVTSVEMENLELSEAWDEVVVNFATTDQSATPFFYAGHALKFPGTRTGFGAPAVLDTATLARNPFMEGTPEFEPVGRRVAWTMEMRDIEGDFSEALAESLSGVNGMEFRYPALEHLMVDLWLGTVEGIGSGMVRVMKNGLVKASGHTDMSEATENLLPTQVINPDGRLVPCFCDQWALLDEWLMEQVLPVGDNRLLGAYLRECLKLVGLDDSEITGVDASVGRRLPGARPGESWLVQPAKGTSLGDWLRHLIDLYGGGRQLWISADGVWQFAFRSAMPVYTFATGDVETRIFKPLDAWREASYNFFRVEGADGPDGLPLGATWTIWRGAMPTGLFGSRLYSGRIVAYPAVRDAALVTQADCDAAVRNLARLYGKPGRGLKTASWMRLNIFPGDRISAYGQEYEVVRIAGGSAAFGTAVATEFAQAPDDELKGNLAMIVREVETLTPSL